MNAKENADLLSYFLSKREKTEGEFPLDLRKNKTDGDFISSFGQKVNFTNWRIKEGLNKTSNQFVIMDIDGFWNEFDSVNTSTNIICQMNCPNCEYSQKFNSRVHLFQVKNGTMRNETTTVNTTEGNFDKGTNLKSLNNIKNYKKN